MRRALSPFDLRAGAALGVHLLVSLVGPENRLSELTVPPVVEQELTDGALMAGVGLGEERVPVLRDAAPAEVARDELGAVALEVTHHQGPQRQRELLPGHGQQRVRQVFGHRDTLRRRSA